MTLSIKKLEIKGIAAQNLTLEVGECVSLSGASGAGKSLVMRALSDLVPNQGQVYLDGQERSEFSAPAWRKRVTFVHASPTWWNDRVADHFQDSDWLEAHLEQLDISKKAMDWEVARLSNGEAQRLSLLRALEGVNELENRYLLLDEPTSALDRARQLMVEALFDSYLKEKHIGVLIVSHDEAQIERFATRHWEIYNRSVREVAK